MVAKIATLDTRIVNGLELERFAVREVITAPDAQTLENKVNQARQAYIQQPYVSHVFAKLGTVADVHAYGNGLEVKW